MRTNINCTKLSLIAWVSFIALALNSFMPSGYMPDFSHPGMLVICDGTDHQAAGHEEHGNHCHKHAIVCPFSAAAISGFGNIKSPQVVPPSYAMAENSLPAYLQPAGLTYFSAASPRSPPLPS